jgi:hypothetical protein
MKAGQPRRYNKDGVLLMHLKFTCQPRREGQTTLRVNPATLDRAFAATNPLLYGSVSEGKVQELMELEIPADSDGLRVPVVGVTDGRIKFEDGRHRARAAARLGLKAIPVIVHKDDVAGLRAVLAKFRAAARAEDLRSVLTELRFLSARGIARELNARKIGTPTGQPWSATTVIGVLRRLGLAS